MGTPDLYAACLSFSPILRARHSPAVGGSAQLRQLPFLPLGELSPATRCPSRPSPSGKPPKPGGGMGLNCPKGTPLDRRHPGKDEVARGGRTCNPAPGPRGLGETRTEPTPAPEAGPSRPRPGPGTLPRGLHQAPTPAPMPAGGAVARRSRVAGSGWLALGSPVTLKVRPRKMVSRPREGSTGSSNIDAAPDCPRAPSGGRRDPLPTLSGGVRAGKASQPRSSPPRSRVFLVVPP